MTAREFFPEGALTLEQWQHLQELSNSLSPEQARWVSGYFAGLDAGLLRAGGGHAVAAPSAPGTPTRTLTILYGTETGNARDLAGSLAAAAREQGLSPELFDMANYKQRRLKDEQDVLIVVSTYGEGDPPQPSVDFFEFVEGRKAPRLEQVRFAVLSLGDSTYEFYCEAGKRLDRRFEELGATRMFDRVDCDIDYEEPATSWSADVLAKLVAEAAESAVSRTSVPAAAAAPAGSTVHDKRNPFAATIIDNIPIVGRHSTKETRHIELDLAGSGLSYEPGDAIGVVAVNEQQVVAALLEAAGLSADAPLTVKANATSLGAALENHFEITASTPRFLEQWAKLSGSSELEALRAEDRGAERAAFLYNHHVVDIVRKFPVEGVDAEAFVAGLRPLQPRLYSIASSLAATPEEAHITLSPVRYTLHGEARSGVASAHLADRLEPGATIPVYIQGNPHFRLPGDDVPIIMIGAGTGVAPYRSFLQEREARDADGKSWLFFGERNFRSDFLYQTEWQTFLKDGVLSRMDVAFSRDKGGKVYVQHRMLERAADLFAWLQDGAHVYVCGDADAMAPDVHEALIRIVAEQGDLERENAEEYVRNLQREHRYQRDVY
jgi:sulfite reductase (NADPH) flavoprotein alpha-component